MNQLAMNKAGEPCLNRPGLLKHGDVARPRRQLKRLFVAEDSGYCSCFIETTLSRIIDPPATKVYVRVCGGEGEQ